MMTSVGCLVVVASLAAEPGRYKPPKPSPELGAATIQLVKAVENGDERISRRAMKALIALGPYAEAAVPALQRIVEEKAEQWDAIRALGAIGPAAKGAVPSLVRSLGRYRESDYAKDALIKIGPSAAAVPSLATLLMSDNGRHSVEKWSVRRNTIVVLGSYGAAAKPAIPLLINFLGDDQPEDQRVWQSAKQSLAELGDDAAPFLADALGDKTRKKDLRVRIAAILWGIRPQAKEVVWALRSAIKDEDEDVRVIAAAALKRIEAKSTHDP